MKSISIITTAAALFAAFSAIATAADERRIEKKIVVGGEPHTWEARVDRKPVTFLGVEADNAPEVVAAQLKLPDGHGLVVNFVVPDSPAAAAGLQKHDVLVKLDDQILVDQRQLAVLVRGHKEGDKVEVAYIRGGAQARATVTLAQHEAPNVDHFKWIGATPGVPMIENHAFAHVEPFEVALADFEGQREALGRARERLWIDAGRAPGRMHPHAGTRVMVFRPKAEIVMSDDDGVYQVSSSESGRMLVARDAKGEVIFSGPIETEEQRAALSDELRAKLDKLDAIEVVEPPLPPAPPATPAPAVAPAPVPAPTPLPARPGTRSVLPVPVEPSMPATVGPVIAPRTPESCNANEVESRPQPQRRALQPILM